MLLSTVLLNLGGFIATTTGLVIDRRQNTSNFDGPTVVDLGYARYQGGRPGTGVDEFLGMRYAKPPIGSLRFRAPEDPLSEFEVQDASKVSFFLCARFQAHGRVDMKC